MCTPKREKETKMNFLSVYRAGSDHLVFFEETNEEDRASEVDSTIQWWQVAGVALVATEPAYGVTGCEDTARNWQEGEGDFFTRVLEGGRYTNFTLVIDKAIFLGKKWGFTPVIQEAKETIAVLNSDCVTAYEVSIKNLLDFILEFPSDWLEVITVNDILNAGGRCDVFGGLSGTKSEVPAVLERLELNRNWPIRPLA